jgi:hypothetical protein
LPALLENIGKKVKISAIEEKIVGQWTHHPELLDVERYQAPAEDEVNADVPVPDQTS